MSDGITDGNCKPDIVDTLRIHHSHDKWAMDAVKEIEQWRNTRDVLLTRVENRDATIRDLQDLENGWMPIETAPKVNKQNVMLAWDGQTRVGYWLDNSASMLPWKGWKTLDMEPWPPGKPTHWRPLPPPPVTDEGK